MRRRRSPLPKLPVDASAAMTTSPSATAPLANDTLATSTDLLAAGAAVARVHHVLGGRWQGFDEVGADHSERGVPTRESVTCTGANADSIVTNIASQIRPWRRHLLDGLAKATPFEAGVHCSACRKTPAPYLT